MKQSLNNKFLIKILKIIQKIQLVYDEMFDIDYFF